jgi:hypothetical protein
MEAVLDFGRGCQDLVIILSGVWGRGGGLPPPANPDNMATGGDTDAQYGEGGRWREGERGDMKQITAHSNPYSSFSLSFCPLCIRCVSGGGSIKISQMDVQNKWGPWIKNDPQDQEKLVVTIFHFYLLLDVLLGLLQFLIKKDNFFSAVFFQF